VLVLAEGDANWKDSTETNLSCEERKSDSANEAKREAGAVFIVIRSFVVVTKLGTVAATAVI